MFIIYYNVSTAEKHFTFPAHFYSYTDLKNNSISPIKTVFHSPSLKNKQAWNIKPKLLKATANKCAN